MLPSSKATSKPSTRDRHLVCLPLQAGLTLFGARCLLRPVLLPRLLSSLPVVCRCSLLLLLLLFCFPSASGRHAGGGVPGRAVHTRETPLRLRAAVKTRQGADGSSRPVLEAVVDCRGGGGPNRGDRGRVGDGVSQERRRTHICCRIRSLLVDIFF